MVGRIDRRNVSKCEPFASGSYYLAAQLIARDDKPLLRKLFARRDSAVVTRGGRRRDDDDMSYSNDAEFST